MITFRAWATCDINRTSFFTGLCRKAADLVQGNTETLCLIKLKTEMIIFALQNRI